MTNYSNPLNENDWIRLLGEDAEHPYHEFPTTYPYSNSPSIHEQENNSTNDQESGGHDENSFMLEPLNQHDTDPNMYMLQQGDYNECEVSTQEMNS